MSTMIEFKEQTTYVVYIVYRDGELGWLAETDALIRAKEYASSVMLDLTEGEVGVLITKQVETFLESYNV